MRGSRTVEGTETDVVGEVVGSLVFYVTKVGWGGKGSDGTGGFVENVGSKRETHGDETENQQILKPSVGFRGFPGGLG